ncbi:hypothetical protein RJ639_015707 [Escallonia herrerae]|uniref:Uncharacterized protein n=1 Tax=Escallonia herrerae TaxID=1293975 RepID=A0AA88VCD5_9ASTE|nr:hypothetical protein RJ639_015707 [Escallonia herrerae]
MAIEAVVSVVIEKLTHLLKEEPVTPNKLIVAQLEEIRKKLEKMRGFLIYAEDKKEPNKAATEWAQKYLLVLYDVEDEIEKFALRVARQRKRLGFLMNHALFFNNLNACRKLRRKMKRIRTKIGTLNDEKPDQVQDASVRSIVSLTSNADEPSQEYQRSISVNGVDFIEDQEQEKETTSDTAFSGPAFDRFPLEMNAMHIHTFSVPTLQTMTNGTARGAAPNFRSRTTSSCFGERLLQPKLMYSYSYDEELGIFGFGEDVHTLVNRLHAQGNHTVPIVGVEGSGKTTLARAIYGKRNVKQFFESRAWIFVSEEYTKRDICLSLLKQLGCLKDQDALMSDEVLKNRLSEHLNKKRSLVVLDDVRTCNVLEELSKAFADTRNGSKIIFTTRDEGIVKYANPHVLDPLSTDDSWDMFLKKANWEETSPLSNADDLKVEILKVCNGIPLNIVLLGGLLSTKDVNSYRVWFQILSRQANWRTLDILLLCYIDLPVHQKLCLLYLVLFPKEFDISVRRLLRLLLAEGFVKRSDSPLKFPEDVVEEYFLDLVNRNLIQLSKNRSDGSPKKCRLLGVLHDYLLPKAQHISLFHLHRSGDAADKGPFGVRRMIEYGDIRSFQCDPSELCHLRSYLSFNFPKKDTPAKEVGKFLSNIIANGFGLLRVLDLERVHKPSLPDNLGALYQLRYLGLRWTFLDTLPPSVGDLPYLETLDVKHTYITSLPSSIWKLKHLRHLNLNYGTRVDVPMQWRGPLTLLTLWGLFVDHKCPVKDGLSRFHYLRELSLTFHLTSSHAAAALVDWIANLTALQSLRLRSKDEAGRPSQINLKSFSSLEKLSHLNLLGNLQKLPDLHEFPPNIKVLTLSVSMLEYDPMPTLGQLHSLTVLRLLANSYGGKELLCRGFLKLRVLKLWMLKKLEDWNVEQGAMPNLKELNIRCCDRLKSIPHRLLRTLDELILTNMPEVITADVQKEKSKHTSLTLNKWDFTPVPVGSYFIYHVLDCFVPLLL